MRISSKTCFIVQLLLQLITIHFNLLGVSSFTLVSDLKTPAFLIDIDMLYKAAPTPTTTTPSNTIPTSTAHADNTTQNDLNFIPPMYLPKYNMTLYPYSLERDQMQSAISEPTQIKEPYPVNQYQGQQSALGYLHSSVIRSRDDLDTSSTATDAATVSINTITTTNTNTPLSRQEITNESNVTTTTVTPSSTTTITSDTTSNTIKTATTTLLPNTFLAELDIGIDLCGGSSSSQQQEQESPPPPPQLVMGINNHHVGSYYWARSAGMGASMETPGILFQNCPISTTATNTSSSSGVTSSTSSSNTGMLCWEGNTPFDCNSNDGKRSEWVNFLRVGDLVQLLPQDLEDALVAFVSRYQEQDEEEYKEENQEEVGVGVDHHDDGGGESEERSISSRIYGFSSKGRPLGSEPMVVCQWCKR